MIMNKLLFSILAIAYVVNGLAITAVARDEPYGGKCLYLNKEKNEQEFKSCQVNIEQETINVNFEEDEYQDENKAITAQSISEIASGEYATRLLSDSGSVVSGILLGPISLVGKIFKPNEDFQQYILQYNDATGTQTATILNIDRADAPELQQELTVVTNKLITFQPKQTDTTIDVGPDVEDVKQLK